MKSHQITNTTPNGQTPTIKRSSNKKILLFASDFESGRIILREINKNKRHIIDTVEDDKKLTYEIARMTPHLLVIHSPQGLGEGTDFSSQVQRSFPDLPVCLVHGDLAETAWKNELQEFLSRPPGAEIPQPYPAESHMIHEREHLKRFAFEPFDAEAQEENLAQLRSQQEHKFLLQLQTARKNHASAKGYLACLSLQQEGVDRELGRGLVRGASASLSLIRDRAAKWLAVLSHYVPDVQVEFLPKPGTAGPTINFVRRDISPEGAYAAMLVSLTLIDPTINEAILELLATRDRGEDAESMLALSLKLYGLGQFLRQTAIAQTELMDRLLDPVIAERPGTDNAVWIHDARLEMFCHVWDLALISPGSLPSLLKGFHDGSNEVQQERFLPSYAEFHDLGGEGEAL